MKNLLIILTMVMAFAFTAEAKTDFSLTGLLGCPPESVIIHGRITDSVTGAGLNGAKMTMMATNYVDVCQQTITDSNGYYTFQYPMYAPNYYVIRAQRRNYVAREEYAYFYNPGYPFLFEYNLTLTPVPE